MPVDLDLIVPAQDNYAGHIIINLKFSKDNLDLVSILRENLNSHLRSSALQRLKNGDRIGPDFYFIPDFVNPDQDIVALMIRQELTLDDLESSLGEDFQIGEVIDAIGNEIEIDIDLWGSIPFASLASRAREMQPKQSAEQGLAANKTSARSHRPRL